MLQNSIQIKSGLRLLYIIGITVLFTAGCKNADDTPDVDDIQVSLNTRRLDQDLAKLDTNNIAAGLSDLQSKYPDFLNFYLDTLMGLGIESNFSIDNPAIQQNMHSYLTHKDYRGLFDTLAVHFPDTKQMDEDLTKGFKYMKHYFPEFKEPKVIYLLTWLNNQGAFTYGDDIVGVGLDMYLGDKYPFYASVGVPEYLTPKFKPEYVAPNVFSVLYTYMHPFEMDDRILLDMMIQKGKQQYFLSKVLPFITEAKRLGYTEAQLKWCTENEALVYNFFIQQKLLYEKNWQKILRYMLDGPTSAGMPAESPGNIGTWVGYQIVKAYAEEHPKQTLPQLLAPSDPQRFLQESKYKPK